MLIVPVPVHAWFTKLDADYAGASMIYLVQMLSQLLFRGIFMINGATKSNGLVVKKSKQQKAGRAEKEQKRGHIRGTKKGRSGTKSEQGEITETKFLLLVWPVPSPVGGWVGGWTKGSHQKKKLG